MKKVIEYLSEYDRRLVVPIGPYEKDLDFLCLGDVAFAKALGFETYKVRDVLEKVVEGQLNTEEELKVLKEEKVFNYEYFYRELEVLKKEKDTRNIPIGGGCFGPLTIVANIIGVEKCNKLSLKKPEFILQVLGYVNSYLIELAKLEEEAGADFFWIAEPLASLFSPKSFERFSGNFIKEIYHSINIPGFLHVCGDTISHTDGLVKTGAQVLSVDYLVDIEENIKLVPNDVVIMGNINPMLLWRGKPKDIEKEVLDLNYKVRNYKNFIMSSGCLIPRGTPKENVELMIKLTKEYPLKSLNG